MSLKIGWIDYLNTLPFNFELTGIKTDFDYQLVKGVPSQINKYLREGSIDVGFVSSAEYIENFKDYYILPDLSISSLNKVHSVLVLSKKPVDQITEIALTTASKTSRYLTKIVFEKFFNKKVSYTQLKNINNAETVLLIGDEAITYRNKFPYIIDLSGEWYKHTKLPFVFALWCVRKDSLEKRKSEILKLSTVLKKSKEKFFEDIEKYMKEAKIKFDTDFAKFYLKNLDFCLSSQHLESLQLFSKYLLEVELIKEKPEFRTINI